MNGANVCNIYICVFWNDLNEWCKCLRSYFWFLLPHVQTDFIQQMFHHFSLTRTSLKCLDCWSLTHLATNLSGKCRISDVQLLFLLFFVVVDKMTEIFYMTIIWQNPKSDDNVRQEYLGYFPGHWSCKRKKWLRRSKQASQIDFNVIAGWY